MDGRLRMGIEGRPPNVTRPPNSRQFPRPTKDPQGGYRLPKDHARLPPVSMQTEEDSREIRDSIPKDAAGDPLVSVELTNGLCKLVREGNTLDNSARVCGLRRTVLEAWLIQGRTDVESGHESPEAKMARGLDAALGDQERVLARIVFAKAAEDPRLALETLSRRNPEKWAPAAPEPVNWEHRYGTMKESELQEEVRKLSAGWLREKNDG